MSRVKSFDSTGVAPNGRLYAGDLNAIQDHYIDLFDLTQSAGVGSIAVGEAGLAISRYGVGDMRVSGALRSDGILRGLGGLIAGAFTTAQRDAIPAGGAPYGLEIINTTTNRYEWNAGTDGARNWKSLDSAPPFLIGTEAARPAATALNSGSGYYATDTTYEYVSNGSAWLRVGVPMPPVPPPAFVLGTEAARPAAVAGNAGTGYYATDTGFLYVSNGSVWSRVNVLDQLAYAQRTSIMQTNGSAWADVVSTGPVAYDGTRVQIEVFASRASVWFETTNQYMGFAISKDGVPICGFNNYNKGSSTVGSSAAHAVFYDTPSAGSHTYAFQIRSDTAGTYSTVWADTGANGTDGPAFIRVTKANS